MMKYSFKRLLLKGTEVAESARQHVEPEELEDEKLVHEFEKTRYEADVRGILGANFTGTFRYSYEPIEKKTRISFR